MVKARVESEETKQRIIETIEYDSETGLFLWKVKRNNRCKNGFFAGMEHPDGYLLIGINGKPYKAHRLAWLLVYGDFPKDQIDHIDQDRSNNRIANLREASCSQNARNCVRSKHNTSGFNGVSFCTPTQKWKAGIKINDRSIHLGSYDNIEDAIVARQAANVKYGFHENHGKERIR